MKIGPEVSYTQVVGKMSLKFVSVSTRSSSWRNFIHFLK